MKNLIKFCLLMLSVICCSCYFITGGSNKFEFDFDKNEIVGSVRWVEIEVDSPLSYYTYMLTNNRSNTNLNILDPDTNVYKLTVSEYGEDLEAYKKQRLILRPNAEYKISNHSNGDANTFSITIKTDSLGRFIK